MALRAAVAALSFVVLALTLCGCVASTPPPPATGSNKPDALLPGAQTESGPRKGGFFQHQPGSGAAKNPAPAGGQGAAPPPPAGGAQ
ncbi:MAG TPA: hypothetical protein VKT78_14765 [Fimbriimonadaceae bacterium]|nr:hypothetical protein [Fimbriimonadaceae bacterium]